MRKPMTMTILPVLFCLFHVAAGKTAPYVPQDSFLLDCGATASTTHTDGRVFKNDQDTASLLAAQDNNQVSAPPSAAAPSPIHQTARVFGADATYTFQMTRPGWHWVRLHFFPLTSPRFDLPHATFSVSTDTHVLLHSFSAANASAPIIKEFILNVTAQSFPLHFAPQKNSVAFVNAIEVVSAPDILIPESGSSLFPVGDFPGLSGFAYYTAYRLNVGGPPITSGNDTLGRTWAPDKPYLNQPATAKSVSVDPTVIAYGDDKGQSPLIAPPLVYASAAEMSDSSTTSPNFNVSWSVEVSRDYAYLLRLHFCDIVSQTLDNLYFNVYINGRTAISNLDLSAANDALAVPYYKDVVVNATVMSSDQLSVQVGPTKLSTGDPNAILNGLEVFRMSNSVNSLDGEFGVDGKAAEAAASSTSRTTVAAVGFAMMFGAFAGLGAMVIKWKKRPQDWQKRNSFSSWLLPLHASDSSFMTGKHSSMSKSTFASSTGLGRYFSFAELQEATKNFDAKAIIGVGGFGNVYIGEIDDGATKVAVKRGNPQSEQGINEFQTEIQMLSKLRHKHLVSLIGYCDENSEMILVYEFMSNGPLRDHLYGKNLPPLPWKKRLEIAIGSARGLHYLHTGAAQGIIHRDVKTTNILLDDDFVSKVADFGLSKCGPTMEQTHVSTAVKGSFGYLDPEYFRRQQLTDKSDVYSFGVVLLEVLCARAAINPSLPREQVSLAEWAMQWKRKGLLEKIIDPHLAGTIDPESMKKFVEAATKCLAEYGTDRPSMGDVLWNLEYALQLQEASSQGKDEEENPAPAVLPSPTLPPTAAAAPPTSPPSPPSTDRQISPPEGSGNSGDGLVLSQHSGTDMFAQFTNLNGR